MLCKYLHEREDKETVRARLTEFPNLQEEAVEDMLRSPDTAQYIDLHLLKDPENMAGFQKAIRLLVDDI